MEQEIQRYESNAVENRSKHIVIKGFGVSGSKGYPTANIYADFDDGIYHCRCAVLNDTYYGIMSAIKGVGEIHLLGFDRECHGEEIEIINKTIIDKDLIINAAMHLYSKDIISLLEETYE